VRLKPTHASLIKQCVKTHSQYKNSLVAPRILLPVSGNNTGTMNKCLLSKLTTSTVIGLWPDTRHNCALEIRQWRKFVVL